MTLFAQITIIFGFAGLVGSVCAYWTVGYLVNPKKIKVADARKLALVTSILLALIMYFFTLFILKENLNVDISSLYK